MDRMGNAAEGSDQVKHSEAKAPSGKTIPSRKQLALIHVAKARVGMTEEDYRSMLYGVGVESSRDLTRAQFDELIRRFEALGFQARGRGGESKVRQYSGDAERGPGMGSPSLGKADHGIGEKTQRQWVDGRSAVQSEIDRTLTRLGLAESYADGISRHMFGIDRVRWLDDKQAFKVLQALKVYTKRLMRRKGAVKPRRKGD